MSVRGLIKFKGKNYIFKRRLIDFYPIGAVYTTMDTTDPSIIFGGSWRNLGARFLYAFDTDDYPAGTTGGSEDPVTAYHRHQVPTTDIASSGAHTHSLSYDVSTDNSTAVSGTKINVAHSTTTGGYHGFRYGTTTLSGGSHSHTVPAHNTGYAGTSATAGKNLPPFMKVYQWERIG